VGRSLGLVALALLAAVSAAGHGELPERETAAELGVTRLVGGAFTYVARAGDSLTSVGARFGVDVATLARQNGLAANARLALGQELHGANPHLVPAVTARDTIVVNIPQRMLFELRGGALVGAYPVAAGRPTWRTPRGEFVIDERAIDKPWVVPLSIQEEMRREGKPVKTVVPPGPENPLGHKWLGLAPGTCGIHGTNAPSSIYGLRTHGCIRLHPDDADALFERSALGDAARLAYEPVLLAALPNGRVCLEVHRDAYHLAEPPEDALARLVDAEAAASRIDPALAREALAAHAGIAIDVTRGSAGGPCT
jgi:L,D-transpeptidase ErfK/SrfK